MPPTRNWRCKLHKKNYKYWKQAYATSAMRGYLQSDISIWTQNIQSLSMKCWHVMTNTILHIQLIPHHKIIPADGQGHTEGPTSYQFISFEVHVNQIIHFWDMAILRICLENLRSESWLGSKVKLIYRHYETHSCWICYEQGEGSVKLLDITGNLYMTWHPVMAKTWCTKLGSEQFGDKSSFGLFFSKLNMRQTHLVNLVGKNFLIWNGSSQSCGRYKVDMIMSHRGQTGQMKTVKMDLSHIVKHRNLSGNESLEALKP